MWYREASLMKLSEYWSDKKLRDELFSIIAKSFKRKNANGDEDRLEEIDQEPPGDNINIFKKIQIGDEIHSLFHQSYDRVRTNLYTAHDDINESLGELCDKYSIDSSDKERMFSIIQQWIVEYGEYVRKLQ
jgi:hypothetical protein